MPYKTAFCHQQKNSKSQSNLTQSSVSHDLPNYRTKFLYLSLIYDMLNDLLYALFSMPLFFSFASVRIAQNGDAASLNILLYAAAFFPLQPATHNVCSRIWTLFHILV